MVIRPADSLLEGFIMLSTLNTSSSGIALNVADSPYKCANERERVGGGHGNVLRLSLCVPLIPSEMERNGVSLV